jgi:hypothetical protein
MKNTIEYFLKNLYLKLIFIYRYKYIINIKDVIFIKFSVLLLLLYLIEQL